MDEESNVGLVVLIANGVIDQQAAENKRLRTVLAEYANRDHWHGHEDCFAFWADAPWLLAREALRPSH